MSVKFPVKISIHNWLKSSNISLKNAGIDSSILDSELILAYVLNKNRTYLHAHPDEVLLEADRKKAKSLLTKRIKRQPLAYLIGKKEFYGRDFIVNKDVLIPRPESESIIDLLKSVPFANSLSTNLKLVDVGTGSGCLGITAKLDIPDLDVTLIDKSAKALLVAKTNAELLGAKVQLLKDSLLSSQPTNSLDIVIANLPYLDKNCSRSPETSYEPAVALFAKDSGTKLIKNLIEQSSQIMKKDGYLIMEFEPNQRQVIVTHAEKLGFKYNQSLGYITVFRKD